MSPGRAQARPAPSAPGLAPPARLHAALLGWYERAARDLPWRRTHDPYAVWLSEVMLQQTRVATVIPYWERFLSRFPDVRALAAAPDDDVLALWSGLGYYARARNLLRAARAVVERHGGRFPENLQELRELPGFGPYTAAAVGSIALGLDAAVVDGNVARVLCRLGGWPVAAEEARKRAEACADALVPPGRAGDWNQALMDLGATVCTPAAPACLTCPVRALCAAAKTGDAGRYPLPKKRPARPRLAFAALVAKDGDAVLMVKRDSEGLFGGLWEPPSAEVGEGGSAHAAARRLAESLVDRPRFTEIGLVKQTLTHREVEVTVFALAGAPARLPAGARLASAEALSSLGLSTLAAKVLRAAGVEAAVPRPAPGRRGSHGRRPGARRAGG